jgi:hypothetical protein
LKEKPVATKDGNKEKPQSKIISWAVFLPTLVVCLISLTSVIFPALVVRTTSHLEDIGGNQYQVNPFEPGVLALPLVATNSILFGIWILYFKEKLPKKILESIRFVFNFEVSKKVASACVLVLLGIYAASSGPSLATEEPWGDYVTYKKHAQDWNFAEIAKGFDVHVKFFLLSASLKIFGNIRVIPFIASGLLLVLTYFFTKEITQKRFAGIVSMVILLQSTTFLTYNTTASYDNFWILLYLFSLYLIYKKWYLSPVAFLLSIPAKQITAIFLPMTLFFIYRSNITKKKKIWTAIAYGIIAIILIVAVQALGINLVSSYIAPDTSHFWMGFTALAIELGPDPIFLIFLLPVIVGLFIASKRKIAQADSILFMILGLLLVEPLLEGLTGNTNQPYRHLPLIIFFGVGVGILLSKRINEQV